MVCKWGRLFFIHPLQTTPLPLEYGTLAGFCPAIVLVVEAERAMVLQAEPEEEWCSQDILCRCRRSAVTREHWGSCHLDLYP